MSITFDGPNKLVTLSTGTTSLSVTGLWSRWVDWLAVADNSKYLPVFRQVGSDPIDEGAGTSIPVYLFQLNGWRLRPQEASHTLNVSGGILLVDGGGDPFVNTIGSYNIRINYSQPVQAITATFFSGGSALSTPEHDKLMGISATALSDEQNATLTAAKDAAVAAQAQATKARQMQTNRAVISPDGLTVNIYDDEGTGILHKFTISQDKNTRLVAQP